MTWAAAAVGLALCAACASGAEPAASTASPAAGVPPPSARPAPVAPTSEGEAVPGLRAEAVHLRTDAAVGGRLQIRVTASASFTVTSAGLDSPGFETLPPREVDTEFAPGRVIDLPVAHGDVRCGRPPLPATARLTLVRAGAGPEQVQAPLAGDVLARIHEEQCAALGIAEVVALDVRDLRPAGDALVGQLALSRRSGDADVRLARILRSVLVAVTADLPVRLAGAADTASTRIGFTPATCEAHVLAETKQPYVFPVTVVVGDAEPVTLDLPLDDAERAQLQNLVDRVCA